MNYKTRLEAHLIINDWDLHLCFTMYLCSVLEVKNLLNLYRSIGYIHPNFISNYLFVSKKKT
jgi:hypothetical protein